MPKLNLKSMSVAELAALRDQITAAISGRIGAERAELQKRMDALNDLDSGSPPASRKGRRGKARNGSGNSRRKAAAPKRDSGKRRTIEPKYRGPGGELWSGRGLPPRWLSVLEADGKKRDIYLIKK